MSRLVMCAFDAASDLGLKEKLCTVIHLLFTLHPEHFWGCWSSLKPAEQKALSGCFGVKDLKNHKEFKEVVVKATVAVKSDATPLPSPVKVPHICFIN